MARDVDEFNPPAEPLGQRRVPEQRHTGEPDDSPEEAPDWSAPPATTGRPGGPDAGPRTDAPDWSAPPATVGRPGTPDWSVPPATVTRPGVPAAGQPSRSEWAPPASVQRPSVPEAPQWPSVPEAVQRPGVPEAVQRPGIPEAAQRPGVPEAVQRPGVPDAAQRPGIPVADAPTAVFAAVEVPPITPIPATFTSPIQESAPLDEPTEAREQVRSLPPVRSVPPETAGPGRDDPTATQLIPVARPAAAEDDDIVDAEVIEETPGAYVAAPEPDDAYSDRAHPDRAYPDDASVDDTYPDQVAGYEDATEVDPGQPEAIDADTGDSEATGPAALEPLDAEPIDAEPMDAEPVDAELTDAALTDAELTAAEPTARELDEVGPDDVALREVGPDEVGPDEVWLDEAGLEEAGTGGGEPAAAEPEPAEPLIGPEAELPDPPSAPAIPVHRELHGVAWSDEYAWMRDHGRAEFAAYLRAERAYHDAATSHLAHLSAALFAEAEQRLLPTEESVSWRHGDTFLHTRTGPGGEYRQLVSSRGAGGPSRILLDEADLAKGLDGQEAENAYLSVGIRELSPDGRVLAYGFDRTGAEAYTIKFRAVRPDRDLTGYDDLVDEIEDAYLGGAWSADSSTFFYVARDATLRAHQVWRHRVGTPTSTDVIVYQEPDPAFSVAVRATRSGGFLVITSESRDTTEVWTIPGREPLASPTLLAERRAGIEYRVDHYAEDDGLGLFLIVTNDGADEFRLMQAPAAAASRKHWRQVAAAQSGERLRACHALADHLLLELRRDGIPLLRVVDILSGEEREIDAGNPARRLRLTVPFEYHDSTVPITVDSLVEPARVYTVDLATGERELLHERRIPGYNPGAYRTERRHVTVAGGARVPVTMAWRADTPLDGTAPCLMWGYGAYEVSADPAFDESLPSLLDRGVVYVRTHPRGGGELGRHWWRQGRLLHKMNTFTDHIAVADWLAASRIVDPHRIATRGHSAGGLLSAAVFSLRPDRWRLVVAEAPFVDPLSTMLDPTLPLTATEWAEWGDPRRPEAFHWLRDLSPYDNVPRGPRPAVLVTGAVNDTRVLIHEPAKWVARLRSRAVPGDGRLLFRPELGPEAHSGPGGRLARAEYEAEIMAVILARLAAVH